MNRVFRFSARLALTYIALCVLVLALFAIRLWYSWRVNLSTFRAYVHGESLQWLTEAFDREGAAALAIAMDSQVGRLPANEIMLFADPSKLPLAGNFPVWPAAVPDALGTYGLVIGLGDQSTMRALASPVTLPGGTTS